MQEPIANVSLGAAGSWEAGDEIEVGQGSRGDSGRVRGCPIDDNVHTPAGDRPKSDIPPMALASPGLYQQGLPETERGAPIPGSLAAYTAVSMNSNVETATARWLGLLLGDVAPENGVLPGVDFEDTGVDIFGNSIVPTPSSSAGRARAMDRSETAISPSSNPFLQERLMKLGGEEVLEKQAWHSNESLELGPQEKPLFQSFVRHISLWVSMHYILLSPSTARPVI